MIWQTWSLPYFSFTYSINPGPDTVGVINVEIGHAHPLGIEEPLEDEVVGHRVEVRDADGVRDDGASRRPARRPDRNPHLARRRVQS
jgi:hypothetical protein